MNDTTLITGLRLLTGRFSPVARLYYYRGNFYWPMDVHGSEIGRIKRAIRDFKKSNQAQITSDQSARDYKTVVELFDQQMEEAWS